MKNNKFYQGVSKFVDGDFIITTKRKPKEPRRPSNHHELTLKERYNMWHDTKAPEFFNFFYRVSSIVICVILIFVLLITVSFLPEFGNPHNPVNNEVSQRYIEKGLEETGATNIVAAMILDYRAFDTFGESVVLFVAAASVMMIMQNDSKKDSTGKKQKNVNPEYKQLPRDPIVKNIAKYIIPFILIFGIYILLNGHISPGGGFAGGAIMGASLILYSSAYGYKTIHTVITDKLIKTVIFCSFTFYGIAKGYSFFTGAHHIPTGIPLGEPGAILSSGLILPLNICVGLIVTCTMYSFYSLFSKGEI